MKGSWLSAFAFLAMLSWPLAGHAQDRQVVPVGNGLPFSECVEAGVNGVLDSTPGGDDDVFSSQVIRSGQNGICETVPAGDDVHPSNGVVFGQGLPNADIIVSGLGGASDDGICDDPTVPAGDDVLLVPAGRSTPRRIAVLPGNNGTIDSSPSGDDVQSTVICPGGDLILDSTVAGGSDDLVVLGHPLCARAECAQNLACIIPGPDDVLQTTPDPADVAADYVSTGADGVSATAAVGDDVQKINVGEGTKEAGCVSAGPDGIAQTSLCGNNLIDVGEQCDGTTAPDCPTLCQSDCICPAAVCGNGVIESGEECDDGVNNSDTTPDACRTSCLLPFCGDGVTDPGNGENCDDGNNSNGDACVVGCVPAVCGDGFRWRSVEECDDGNLVSGDGCDANCMVEVEPGCGNGVIDGTCSAGKVGDPCSGDADCDTGPSSGDGACDLEQCDDGNSSNKDDCLNNCIPASCGDGFLRDKGSGPFEECDDGNTQAGDGCSATCEIECGNGVIDGACSQGTVGASCSTNADCDSAPSSGDGVCVTEECDIGIDGLCSATPPTCSSSCLLASCGNGVVECTEECDLGSANGQSGSGCSADCKRNLIGRREFIGRRECLGGWTLDSPPEDPKRKVQRCPEGSACDFDVNPNQCTFRVGFCLNRPEPLGCDAGNVISVDLRRLHVDRPLEAAAAETLTSAIAALGGGLASVPDRCRKGERHKICSIPDNSECDTYLGAGNGICDIGTGVTFSPVLTPVDLGGTQVTTCTPGMDIVVPVGGKFRVSSRVRRLKGRGDGDAIVVKCMP